MPEEDGPTCPSVGRGPVSRVLRGVSARGSMSGPRPIEASLSQMCRAAGMAGDSRDAIRSDDSAPECVCFAWMGTRVGEDARCTV